MENLVRLSRKKEYASPRMTTFEDCDALLQAYAAKGNALEFAQVQRFLSSTENIDAPEMARRRAGR